MQAAIKALQEAAIVTAAMEARHAEALKDHEKWLIGHDRAMHRIAQGMEQHEKRMERIELNMAEGQRMERIELNLAELGDKLTALIQIVHKWIKRNGAK